MHHEWKNKAIQLRKKGYSYNLIREKIPVSKSTLSYWLRDIPFRPNALVKKRVNERLLRSSIARNHQRLESIQKAQHQARQMLGPISKRDLLLFGLGLYLGEGSKLDQQTKIINSSPRVIRLSILWFKESFGLTDDHFRIMLHLYPDSNEKECREYWSKVTGIPKSQFQKTQIDMRTNKSPRKHRKLPHGTAHIRVNSNGKPEFGVNLFRQIMSSVEVVFENYGIIMQHD